MSKVLIVDDSALARRTMRAMLEEMRFVVEDAPDGVRALELFYLGRHDLVILDMVMSGMYGLEVLAKLRELEPEVNVIVVTADIQTSTAQQVKSAGAKAMLNKPVNREALSQTVQQVLQGGRAWN